MTLHTRGSPEWEEMRERHLAKLKEEFQRYSTGDNRTEYGRGWNCAMEEAEAIVERIIGEPPTQPETTT